MKVFISWSGDRSKTVALALREWLPDVIQDVKPWVSASDIDAGARWSADIARQLSETKFGIICLTAENQLKPWILFEAGALAKTLDGTFLCPYLIGLESAEVLPGPLTQLQAKRSDREGTWALVQTLNKARPGELIDDQRLERIFDRTWPTLEETLKNLPSVQVPELHRRSAEEMMVEALDIVRGLDRRFSLLSRNVAHLQSTSRSLPQYSALELATLASIARQGGASEVVNFRRVYEFLNNRMKHIQEDLQPTEEEFDDIPFTIDDAPEPEDEEAQDEDR